MLAMRGEEVHEARRGNARVTVIQMCDGYIMARVSPRNGRGNNGPLHRTDKCSVPDLPVWDWYMRVY